MHAKLKIATNLWFDSNAEAAVEFYVSLFEDAIITSLLRAGNTGSGQEGSVAAMSFELEGQNFVAMNGGPQFKFNEAISIAVLCDSQDRIDALWEKLPADGGSHGRCGWLKDRFGLSWQIVPTVLSTLLADTDPARAARVMKAMTAMGKLDIEALELAYDG